MGKILTIANRKGGTGKTTASFNLAWTLALNKRRVLLVDLDSQCNLTSLCNAEPLDLETWKAARITGLNAFIDLLPGSKRFGILENEISNAVNRNGYLKKEIIPKLSGYEFIIMDTSPSFSILNLNAFMVSDFVFAVINPDRFSLEGLKDMREIIGEVREFNADLKFRIVLNDYAAERIFYKDLRPILKKDPEFSGVEIPSREIVNRNNALRRPSVDTPDILNAFSKLVEVIA